jgi:hypothetical protein
VTLTALSVWSRRARSRSSGNLTPADPAVGLLDQEQAAASAIVRLEKPQEPTGKRVHAGSPRTAKPAAGTRAGLQAQLFDCAWILYVVMDSVNHHEMLYGSARIPAMTAPAGSSQQGVTVSTI